MKKRDFILCTLSGLSIGMMLFFMACSGKQTRTAEDDSEGDETEETLAAAEEASEDGEKKEEKVEELEASLDGEKKEDELQASAEEGIKKSEENKSEDVFSLDGEEDKNKNVAELNEAIEAPITAPEINSEPVQSVLPAPEPEPRAVIPASKPKGLGKVPQIPGRAIKVKNKLLNRFYFVRKGDTPAKVSSLLYGSPTHAKDLTNWNTKSGTWRPGKLVFYSSPTQPEDAQMQSFYQERSVPAEEYEVAQGEGITTIAKNQLGNPGSWKEIAVVNGLDKPSDLESGKKLTIYPKDLSPYGAAAALALAANRSTPEPTPAQPAVSNTPPPMEAQAPAPPPVDKMPTPPTDLNKGKKAPQKGFDVGVFLKQNLFTLAMGGVVALLLVTLLAVNKRKKKTKKDDFMDDGFANQRTKRK